MLTPKEKLFCINYCSNGYNASDAALKAGYSKKTSRMIASEMLKKEHIIKEVERLNLNFDELIREKGITKSLIVEKNWEIANSSIAYMHNTWVERKEFENLTESQKACIQEIDTKVEYRVFEENKKIGKRKIEFVKIKLYNKQEALKEITKIMGWYSPIKQETDVNNKIEVNSELTTLLTKYLKLNDNK